MFGVEICVSGLSTLKARLSTVARRVLPAMVLGCVCMCVRGGGLVVAGQGAGLCVCVYVMKLLKMN